MQIAHTAREQHLCHQIPANTGQRRDRKNDYLKEEGSRRQDRREAGKMSDLMLYCTTQYTRPTNKMKTYRIYIYMIPIITFHDVPALTRKKTVTTFLSFLLLLLLFFFFFNHGEIRFRLCKSLHSTVNASSVILILSYLAIPLSSLITEMARAFCF